MPALHVRNVPEEVMAALRERADRHGRSMQQEILEILGRAADERLPQSPPAPIRLVTVRTSGDPSWSREEIYGDEGR